MKLAVALEKTRINAFRFIRGICGWLVDHGCSVVVSMVISAKNFSRWCGSHVAFERLDKGQGFNFDVFWGLTCWNLVVGSASYTLEILNDRRLPLALLVYLLFRPLMTTSVRNNSVFRSFFEKQKLTGPNFINWYRQLWLVLSTKDKEQYLEQPIPAAPVAAAPD
ncbi:hypothetical protein Tco_0385132 [Tanacetum coccineum]